MGWLFKRKKDKGSGRQGSAQGVDRIRCPFCLREIKNEDVVFATAQGSSQDPVFLDFVSQYAYMDEVVFSNHSGAIYRQDDPGVEVIRDERTGFPMSIRARGGDGRSTPIGVRLCGHCHCQLPANIESAPVRTLLLLGGSSSGKTTYLAALADTLAMQLQALNLGHAELAAESAESVKRIVGIWKRSERSATVPLPLFPTVISIFDNTRVHGNNIILSIHDFAGEGMRNPNYILNHPATQRPDGVLMLVDVNQLEAFSGRVHVENACQETLTECFALFTSEIIHSLSQADAIAVVLSKFDILLSIPELRQELDNPQAIAYSPLMKERHDGAVDLMTLKDVSTTLRGLFEKKGAAALKTLYKYLAEGSERVLFPSASQLDPMEFFGVSTMQVDTMEEGEEGYANRYREGMAMHRMAEPLLYILAKWNVLNTK